MSHSQISDFSKTFNKNSKPLTNQKTTDFSKLGEYYYSKTKDKRSWLPWYHPSCSKSSEIQI